MPRWLAVTLAAGLALWTACIWMFYVQNDGAYLWPDFLYSLPHLSGFFLHRWLIDLGFALLLAFAACAHGAWILDRLDLESRGAERVLTATGIGFAGLILTATILGFAHLLRPVPLRTLMVLFFLTGLVQSQFWKWKWRPRPIQVQWTALAPLLLTAAFLGMTLFAAAAPETGYDALSWHLPTARFFLQRGTFAFMELFRSNVPEYGTILYALGLAVHNKDLTGESAAHMLNFLMLPGMALAGAALVKRLLAPLTATLLPQALAALWIVSAPVVMHRAATCYPDLGASLWGMLAVIAFLQYQDTRRRSWVVLCGLFAGMSAGSKFVGFYWIAIGGLLVAVATLIAENRRAALRAAATFAIVSGTLCAPWLIRNWINTGDPVVPMLQKYLPNPSWNLQEAANTLGDANNFSRIPATAANFLALPWRITMDGERWQGTIGPVFLWLAPFALLGARPTRTWLWIVAVLLAYSALWLKGPQWARYYMAPLPLAASLGAAGLCHPRLPRWLRASAIAISMLFPLVNMPGLNQSWIGGGSYVLQEIPWQVAIGPQTPDEYRRIQLPDYDAALYLNQYASPKTAAILPVPVLHFFPPWLTRFKVLDVWENSRAVCHDANRSMVEPCYTLKSAELFANVKRFHVDILAIRRDDNWSANHGALRLEDPFLRRHFRWLGNIGGTFLYERDPAAPEPGFFYVNADLISRWTQKLQAGSAGDVQLLPQGPRMGDGRFAMFFAGQSRAWFDVDLADHPQLVFSAAQDARYMEPGRGTLAIFVDGRQLFEYYIEPKDLTQQWRELKVNLEEFAGKSVHLEMRLTGLRPGEKPTLGIADPVIYAQETAESVPGAADGEDEEEDSRWPFNPASKRHPVAVQFSPDVVRPGGSYQMEIPQLANGYVDLLYSFNGAEPASALHFQNLDAHGRATIAVPGEFSPLPSTLELRGVRRSGDTLWLAASGKIEVRK